MAMPDCPPGCQEHYGCRLRDKGIQVSPQATPTRHNRKPTKGMQPPSHWADCVYDERPDGSKMPVLNPDGTPVRHRQAQRESERIEQLKRFQHQSDPAS